MQRVSRGLRSTFVLGRPIGSRRRSKKWLAQKEQQEVPASVAGQSRGGHELGACEGPSRRKH